MATEFRKQCLYTLNDNGSGVPLGGVVWLPFQPTDWESLRDELQNSGWFLCDGSYVTKVKTRFPEFARIASLIPVNRCRIITGLNPELTFTRQRRVDKGSSLEIKSGISMTKTFDKYIFTNNSSTNYYLPLPENKLLNDSKSSGYYNFTTDCIWQIFFLLVCNLGYLPFVSSTTVNSYTKSKVYISNAEIVGKLDGGYHFALTLDDPSNWPQTADCPTMYEALLKLYNADHSERESIFANDDYRLNRWFSVSELILRSDEQAAVTAYLDQCIANLTKYGTADSSYRYDYMKAGLGGTSQPVMLNILKALRDGGILSVTPEDHYFQLPNLLDSRSTIGYSTSIGVTEAGTATAGAIPNIKGAFMCAGREPGSRDPRGYYNIGEGPFVKPEDNAYIAHVFGGNSSGDRIRGYRCTFDPRLVSTLYQDGATSIVPAGIKAIPVMRLG